MRIADSRRLTGSNLQSANPCAVAEVRFTSGDDVERMLARWREALRALCAELGVDFGEPFVRAYQGGASIGFDAPIDALYAATEINEEAIHRASQDAQRADDRMLERLRRALQGEANPQLIALERAAKERGCPFLWDDDEVSVGFGHMAQVWRADELPDADAVDWASAAPIPVAMITGTNGKTTTSRMLTRILKTSGLCVGSTSTDGVCVDEEIVEAGDWTGTGAARMVLRRKEINAAVLETARGGLLRRGLSMSGCDVAVLTNVAADHLGDYGIDDVAAMAQVKSLIGKALKPGGHRVINADDPHLMQRRLECDSPMVLFSMRHDNEALLAHRRSGGLCWWLEDDVIQFAQAGEVTQVLAARAIPCSFDGAARHNISNALAAAAAAQVLGVSLATIARALSSFGASPSDNPGRCQLFEVQGVRLLLDFGHNAHGLQAILTLAQGLIESQPSARLCVSLGQAGDRLDSEILELSETLADVAPDHIILRQMAGYERGRQPSEVAELIRQGLLERSYPPERVAIVEGELTALDEAMTWAEPGDLIMLLVHLEREAVADWVAARR